MGKKSKRNHSGYSAEPQQGLGVFLQVVTGGVLCGRQPHYCLVVMSRKPVEAEIKALSFTLTYNYQSQCTHIACVIANAVSSLSACVYQMGIHAPGCGLPRAGQALALGTLFLSRGDDLGGHLALKQGQG